MEICINESSGIYMIKNILTGGLYIGSAVNFMKRSRKHIYQLNLNEHHSIILQNSWSKHGGNNFVFIILEIVEKKEELLQREQFYFDLHKPEYNILKNAGSNLGKKHSAETKKKMSDSHKGEKAPWFGKKLTPEMIEKNRIAHLGKIPSIETREKMSASHKKRYIDKESPCKGRVQPSDERAKRSISGKKAWSDKILREKHSDLIKKWWAERKKNKNK
jgi:group I intron endonuclease